MENSTFTYEPNSTFYQYGNDSNYTELVCDPQGSGNPIESPEFQITVYIMYSVIFLVAVIGNGIICYIVLSSSRMRTVTNYFIMNLAIGDILITIFCVPFTSVSSLQQYWSFGSLLCPVVNYSQAVSVFVSAYTMLAISLDRYIAIMWPLKPRLSKKFAIMIILSVWIFAGLTALPIPVMTSLDQPNDWYIACDRYHDPVKIDKARLNYGNDTNQSRYCRLKFPLKLKTKMSKYLMALLWGGPPWVSKCNCGFLFTTVR
ncbi:hypothetical protein PPYR_05927 [Photinus pyralis]|uniref:G-protein coupled receptors family 1 profile domain-containing protein n=1 Tax=Photinus pyralis TaxID=7054 RepID=A0A5N4AS72_PHOPY|nr:hypothetical protein PPYR_05927 [Photinus pyralis]